MDPIPSSVWSRIGCGLLAGGLGMIFFASLIALQGECVPPLFLLSAAVILTIGVGMR